MREYNFFKIHGICLVKDEADIIEQTLRAAVLWCDFIYVFDNGSADNTWQIVLDLSQEFQQIIPYKSDGKNFSNQLRGEVFNHYSSENKDGDWWCILDADEFYIDDPRTFLAKIPTKYEAVWNASFQYYFTDEDLLRYNEDPVFYESGIPVNQRMRYYINNWSELRFFRHRDGLVWTPNEGYPANLGAVYPTRIWLKHFQYRTPEQIQRRLDSRYKAGRIFIHEIQVDFQSQILGFSKLFSQPKFQTNEIPSWRERVVDSSHLYYDFHDRKHVVREDLMPELPKTLMLESRFICQELVNRLLKFIGKFPRKIQRLCGVHKV